MADVLVDRDGAVATVTLNRPDRLNALSLAAVELLRDTLDGLAADRGRPGGRAHRVPAGASAPAVTCRTWPRAARARVGPLDRPGRPRPGPSGRAPGSWRSCARCRNRSSPPSTGPAPGAGMSLACAADLRVASTDAVFTTAFVGVGQTGDYGLAWTLPRLVGRGPGPRAVPHRPAGAAPTRPSHLGLVEEVYAPDALVARAAELAAAIAARAPLTVAAIKASLVDAEALDLGAVPRPRSASATRPTPGPRTRPRRRWPSWRSATPCSGAAVAPSAATAERPDRETDGRERAVEAGPGDAPTGARRRVRRRAGRPIPIPSGASSRTTSPTMAWGVWTRGGALSVARPQPPGDGDDRGAGPDRGVQDPRPRPAGDRGHRRRDRRADLPGDRVLRRHRPGSAPAGRSRRSGPSGTPAS